MARTKPNGLNGTGANGHTTARIGEKRPLDEKSEEEERVEAAKKPKLSERTDYSRWRLQNEEGRQAWHYLEDDELVKDWPQTFADKYFLGLPIVRIFPFSILDLHS
jgi:lanosterol synthase